jgi:3-oxoacyl-[acyl-carrier-protein] synthase III
MGNQVAVSLPMVLHSVLTTKETRQGDIVLLIGSGAGLSLGLGIIEI